MALHVLDEANRCLGCKKPMCQQGCPIHTNIPEVIRLLKNNQLDANGTLQYYADFSIFRFFSKRSAHKQCFMKCWHST